MHQEKSLFGSWTREAGHWGLRRICIHCRLVVGIELSFDACASASLAWRCPRSRRKATFDPYGIRRRYLDICGRRNGVNYVLGVDRDISSMLISFRRCRRGKCCLHSVGFEGLRVSCPDFRGIPSRNRILALHPRHVRMRKVVRRLALIELRLRAERGGTSKGLGSSRSRQTLDLVSQAQLNNKSHLPKLARHSCTSLKSPYPVTRSGWSSMARVSRRQSGRELVFAFEDLDAPAPPLRHRCLHDPKMTLGRSRAASQKGIPGQ
jgi:hypothetical protein